MITLIIPALRIAILNQVHTDGTPIERYLAEHGLRHYAEYQPGSRFWTLQAIESAWFSGRPHAGSHFPDFKSMARTCACMTRTRRPAPT